MKKKDKQLGMPFGTACARLKKLILFNILSAHSENICFRCNLKIEKPEDLTVEHKEPWLDGDIKLFWDMENIAFSHPKCNRMFKRPNKPKEIVHGTIHAYSWRRCRCNKCVTANREHSRKNRENKRRLAKR